MHSRAYRSAGVTADPVTMDHYINRWFRLTPWARRSDECLKTIRRTIRCQNDPNIKKGQRRARFERTQGEFNF